MIEKYENLYESNFPATLAIGKQAKPVWPRGERLPDSEVVITDRFPER